MYVDNVEDIFAETRCPQFKLASHDKATRLVNLESLEFDFAIAAIGDVGNHLGLRVERDVIVLHPVHQIRGPQALGQDLFGDAFFLPTHLLDGVFHHEGVVFSPVKFSLELFLLVRFKEGVVVEELIWVSDLAVVRL
jgi:hypothetical protein